MKIHAPALALGLSLLCNLGAYPVLADVTTPDTTKANNAAKDDNPELKVELKMDPQAEALLHKISDFYAGQKSFETNLQREGKIGKESHTAVYKVAVEKPSKLSIQIQGGSERFDGGQAKMDGQKLYLYNPIFGYVVSPATENYDDLVRDHEFQFATAFLFHGQNLLEALVTANPYEFMQNHYGIKGGSVVGQEKIDGVDTDHLRLESHRVSYDVWVMSGDKPWVRRVQTVRSKHKNEGTLTLTFDYTNSADKTFEASQFAFTAPQDAREIASFFGADNAAKTGEKAAAAAAPAGAPENPLVNTPAAGISLDTIGGDKFDLAAFKDKNVVVLDFWATWCPPCKAALPILSEVTKSYEAKGVKFLAVDLKEDASKVKEYLQSQKLDVNVAIDTDGAIAGKYMVKGIPQSVIIGKDGLIKAVHVGFGANYKEKLTAELESLLAGKEIQ